MHKGKLFEVPEPITTLKILKLNK